MLQRPQYETEPLEAANRFGDALSKLEDITQGGSTSLDVSVKLLDIPVCEKIVEHIIRYDSNGAQRITA